ncbi:MAG: 3-phosphoshikimate 1-carboxyvinyltransferase [Anaerolineales bacterium]|nr:3-phosphoshikimate 1-carboxyvinyltransferase [Anaerolineales bacterium]
MKTRIRVRPGKGLQGNVRVPSDKSLSHRALILGALATGDTHVRGFLPAGDTLATLGCMEALGVRITRHTETTLTVHGVGLGGLEQADTPLDCVNAGTGIRLLAGVMSGQQFPSVLDGSDQLRRRPMRRITEPLRIMGADIEDTEGCAPLYINGSFLNGITYRMPIASGQVKGCLLLAGMFADSPTTVIEPGPSRDHTERMLTAMGVDVHVDGYNITISPPASLKPLDLTIASDISSAAFLIVLGALNANTSICLEDVGINPTRTGLLDVLAAMGAAIRQTNPRDEGGEPVADLVIEQRPLTATAVNGEVVVRMIDEFPILMVAATQARGKTTVTEAEELRYKETDRIAVMATELRKLGATVQENKDGFVISGPQYLRGAVVDGHNDHRVAMSMVVAGLLAMGETIVEDAHCINDSFPGFVEVLQQLGADVEWVD